MKKSNKFLAMLLSIIVALSVTFTATACGVENLDDGEHDDQTTIRVYVYNGGGGSQWLYKAAEKFQTLKAKEKYHADKEGVYIDIFPSKDRPQSTEFKTSGTNIYFDSYGISELLEDDLILPLDDVYNTPIDDMDGDGVLETTLKDKFVNEALPAFKGSDGKFYGVPYYNLTHGFSLDAMLFDKYCAYFAAPDNEAGNVTTYTSKYGTSKMLTNLAGKKSCGTDGVYGTTDDGLPSSLEELLTVCQYLQSCGVIDIINSPGAHEKYSNMLVQALWETLAGVDEMRATMNMSGKIKVVTGYKDENLFPGIDYIKAPIVEEKTITKETAYLAYRSAARYYAIATADIMHTEGFFSGDCNKNTMQMTQMQERFVLNGLRNINEKAFLLEGNYWFNEAAEFTEAFKYYDEYAKVAGREDIGDRKVIWMASPTTLKGSIEEGKANQVCCLGSSGAVVVNRNVEGDEGLVRAIKEFLMFLYTQEELEEYAKNTGLKYNSLNYQLSNEVYESLPTRQINTLKALDNAVWVYKSTDIDLWTTQASKIGVNYRSNIHSSRYVNTVYYSVLKALIAGSDAKTIFEDSYFTEKQWEDFLK